MESSGQLQSLGHLLTVSDDVTLEGSSQDVWVGERGGGGGGVEGGRGGDK